jgi:flagellar biosynthetic protein FliR
MDHPFAKSGASILVLNEADVLGWLGRFLWPFLRITGLFLTAPLYNSAFVPRMVKVAISTTYAISLAMWLPSLPPFPGDPASAILQGLLQISQGALLGMLMQIVVSTVASAGELVGLSIGLGFAELQFREATTVTPVLYDIMFWAGLIGYMTAGGPLWLFAALAHSFQNGVAGVTFTSWAAISAFGGTLIASAVWLALPVLAVSLCVNIIVGLSTVFAPQMNLLTIGFPLLILTALWLFSSTISYLDRDIKLLVLQAASVGSRMLNHV